MAYKTAWRTLASSNGLCRVLKRHVYWFPTGLISTSLTLASCFNTGRRSCRGDSITSISPLRSALMAVWWSAMARHSTRSTLATLPPARPDGASDRALYWANFTYTALSPGFHSSDLKTKGPEPVKSLICSFGEVSATSLGIMKGTFELGLPRAWRTRPVGSLRMIWKVLGLTLAKSFTNDIIFWPMESLAPQRLMEATQSSEVTGAPSCQRSPSRRVSV